MSKFKSGDHGKQDQSQLQFFKNLLRTIISALLAIFQSLTSIFSKISNSQLSHFVTPQTFLNKKLINDLHNYFCQPWKCRRKIL